MIFTQSLGNVHLWNSEIAGECTQISSGYIVRMYGIILWVRVPSITRNRMQTYANKGFRAQMTRSVSVLERLNASCFHLQHYRQETQWQLVQPVALRWWPSSALGSHGCTSGWFRLSAKLTTKTHCIMFWFSISIELFFYTTNDLFQVATFLKTQFSCFYNKCINLLQ